MNMLKVIIFVWAYTTMLIWYIFNLKNKGISINLITHFTQSCCSMDGISIGLIRCLWNSEYEIILIDWITQFIQSCLSINGCSNRNKSSIGKKKILRTKFKYGSFPIEKPQYRKCYNGKKWNIWTKFILFKPTSILSHPLLY